LHQQHNDPESDGYTADITRKTPGFASEIEKQEDQAGQYRQPDQIGMNEIDLLKIDILQARQNHQAIGTRDAIDAIHEVIGIDDTDDKNIKQYDEPDRIIAEDIEILE